MCLTSYKATKTAPTMRTAPHMSLLPKNASTCAAPFPTISTCPMRTRCAGNKLACAQSALVRA